MESEIEFKAVRVSVSVHSKNDIRWNLKKEKSGSPPINLFLFREKLVEKYVEKLYELQETLGAPPSDLYFKVTTEWSLLKGKP
jgi:hypothetical protein